MNIETKAMLFSAGITAAMYFFTEIPSWGIFVSYGVFWNMAFSWYAKQDLESLVTREAM